MPSSWQWWTALTNADFKDGLIYLDTGNEDDLFNLDVMMTDGDFHDSKLLWAFGNFSRFIKPNMVRIAIQDDIEQSIEAQYKDLMLSAYLDTKTNEIAIVAINYSNENKNLDFSDFDIKSKYETSASKNLDFKALNSNKINLSPRSVTTLIGYLK